MSVRLLVSYQYSLRLGWGQILECMYFTYFPINCMLRSFQCFEISLSDQTPGAETLSKVCVWTNESSAGSVLGFVQSSTKVVQLSFFCCLLPITNCLLPISYCQLLIADYQWPNDKITSQSHLNSHTSLTPKNSILV